MILGGFALLASCEEYILEWNSYVSYKTSLTIGDTITWVTWDGESHTVQSIDGSGELNSPFFTGSLNNNATFSHTFNTAGIFKYYCSLHASMMMGEATVVDPNAPVDPPVAEPVAAPVAEVPIAPPQPTPVAAPISVEVPIASPIAAPVAQTPTDTVTPVDTPTQVVTPASTLPPTSNNNFQPNSGQILCGSALLAAVTTSVLLF